MNIRNTKQIRHTARQSLASNTGRPATAALIYAGVSCLLALAATGVSYFLNQQIAGTGGLSNMGLRSVLATADYILPFVQVIVSMGLGLGYCALALDMARNRPARPRTLLEGFYRFFPLLRSALLQGAIYLGISIGCVYLSSWIFMMLPASEAFYNVMEPYLSSMTVMDSGLVIDDATLMEAASTMTPMVLIFAVVFALAALPVYYQYRMVSYCLLDSDRPGAFAALRESRNMMRRNRLALVRLDLSFWWYYLLEALAILVCYGDMLLPMVGVTLPWSGTASYFLFYAVSLVLQFLVYYLFLNRVQVTYATAYEALRPRPQSGGVPLGNIFDLARDYRE